MTVFFAVQGAEDRGAALAQVAKTIAAGAATVETDGLVRVVDLNAFSSIPGTPFAYWLRPRMLKVFRELARFGNMERSTRVGLGTLNDYRFLRLWTECTPQTIGVDWVPLANGGVFSRYYGMIPQVVLWSAKGKCLKAYVEAAVGSSSRKIQSESFYFRPGVTWPLRARAFCPQMLPAGCAFSARGYAAFVPQKDILPLVALGSSCVFDALYKAMLGRLGFPEFLVGTLLDVPVPPWDCEDQAQLGRLAHRGWILARSLDTRNETAHAFCMPALLQADGDTIMQRSAAWAGRVYGINAELAGIQSKIDAHCFDLYLIDVAGRRAISDGLGAYGDSLPDEQCEAESDSGEADDGSVETISLTLDLLSWTIGVAFGRFDVRLATGVLPLPPEPEPFDPLPTHSPGMLPAPYPAWRLGPLSSPPPIGVNSLFV